MRGESCIHIHTEISLYHLSLIARKKVGHKCFEKPGKRTISAFFNIFKQTAVYSGRACGV